MRSVEDENDAAAAAALEQETAAELAEFNAEAVPGTAGDEAEAKAEEEDEEAEEEEARWTAARRAFLASLASRCGTHVCARLPRLCAGAWALHNLAGSGDAPTKLQDLLRQPCHATCGAQGERPLGGGGDTAAERRAGPRGAALGGAGGHGGGGGGRDDGGRGGHGGRGAGAGRPGPAGGHPAPHRKVRRALPGTGGCRPLSVRLPACLPVVP